MQGTSTHVDAARLIIAAMDDENRALHDAYKRLRVAVHSAVYGKDAEGLKEAIFTPEAMGRLEEMPPENRLGRLIADRLKKEGGEVCSRP